MDEQAELLFPDRASKCRQRHLITVGPRTISGKYCILQKYFKSQTKCNIHIFYRMPYHMYLHVCIRTVYSWTFFFWTSGLDFCHAPVPQYCYQVAYLATGEPDWSLPTNMRLGDRVDNSNKELLITQRVATFKIKLRTSWMLGSGLQTTIFDAFFTFIARACACSVNDSVEALTQ